MKTITLLKSALALLVAVAVTACDPTPPPPEQDGIITGTITDQETGKPIEKATVSLLLGSETPGSVVTE